MSRILEIIKEQGRTQSWVARRLNPPMLIDSFRKRCTGYHQMKFTDDQLCQISKLLGVSVEELKG